MRCKCAQLTLVAACWALGCGGKALETSEPSEPVADVCPKLQQAADSALQRLVEANNRCDNDADCANVEGVGECYTYCVVPVRRSNVTAVTESGRDLCRSYVEHDCSASFACPNSAGAGCVEGRCAFKY